MVVGAAHGRAEARARGGSGARRRGRLAGALAGTLVLRTRTEAPTVPIGAKLEPFP